MFTWYWLADLCQDEGITFILGHALYMRAIHGGKQKDDKIDSEKIARLMRGGTFPLSYVYPREMRATRDLLRRRTFLMRRRSELLTHVQLVNQQYNNDPFEKMLQQACNRDILDRFEESGARQSVETDLQTIGHYDQLLKASVRFSPPGGRGQHDTIPIWSLASVCVRAYDCHKRRRGPQITCAISLKEDTETNHWCGIPLPQAAVASILSRSTD